MLPSSERLFPFPPVQVDLKKAQLTVDRREPFTISTQPVVYPSNIWRRIFGLFLTGYSLWLETITYSAGHSHHGNYRLLRPFGHDPKCFVKSCGDEDHHSDNGRSDQNRNYAHDYAIPYSESNYIHTGSIWMLRHVAAEKTYGHL